MKTQAAVLAVLCVFAGSSMASSDAVIYPANAIDDSDPQVAAFYIGQCESWANERGLAGIEKQNYVDGCRANGPAIWPFGTEAPSGSE